MTLLLTLGLNPNTANLAQKRLEQKGFVEFLWVEDGRARLKILSPTEAGSDVVGRTMASCDRRDRLARNTNSGAHDSATG